MKFLAFYVFFWKERNFNEKFDGIVYAVYIALGFAGIENIVYAFTGGVGVGLVRALTAVAAHALFGVVMGFYFGLAGFITVAADFVASLLFSCRLFFMEYMISC